MRAMREVKAPIGGVAAKAQTRCRDITLGRLTLDPGRVVQSRSPSLRLSGRASSWRRGIRSRLPKGSRSVLAQARRGYRPQTQARMRQWTQTTRRCQRTTRRWQRPCRAIANIWAPGKRPAGWPGWVIGCYAKQEWTATLQQETGTKQGLRLSSILSERSPLWPFSACFNEALRTRRQQPAHSTPRWRRNILGNAVMGRGPGYRCLACGESVCELVECAWCGGSFCNECIYLAAEGTRDSCSSCRGGMVAPLPPV